MGTEQERRRAYRAHASGRAICSGRDTGDQYTVVDLSTRGAQLRWGRSFPIGTEVQVELLSEKEDALRVAGTVVHVGTDGSSMGVAFAGVSNADIRRLEDLVFDAVISDSRAIPDGGPFLAG